MNLQFSIFLLSSSSTSPHPLTQPSHCQAQLIHSLCLPTIRLSLVTYLYSGSCRWRGRSKIIGYAIHSMRGESLMYCPEFLLGRGVWSTCPRPCPGTDAAYKLAFRLEDFKSRAKNNQQNSILVRVIS